MARALAAEPKVLLMDEPFGALDPIIRAKAQDDLLAIQKQLRHDHRPRHPRHGRGHPSRRQDRRHGAKASCCNVRNRRKILTEPADPFVQQLTGTSDRALKLMSLLPLKESMQPLRPGLGYSLPQTLNLRDALAEMIWQGADEALPSKTMSKVPVGSISMRHLIELGRKA